MKHFIHRLFVAGLISSVMAQDPPPPEPTEQEKDVAPPAVQTPEFFRRVDVITLAVPSERVAEQLIPPAIKSPADERNRRLWAATSMTAQQMVELWQKGEAELLETLTVNAGSRTAGQIQNTAVRYFYKGVRSGGQRGEIQIPDYEQRDVGSKLTATLTAKPEGERLEVSMFTAKLDDERLEVSIDVAAEYAFLTEVQPAKGDQAAVSYPSIAKVKFTGKAHLYNDRYTLIGGGGESPDKKTLLFLLARLGVDDNVPPTVPALPPGPSELARPDVPKP